MQRSQGLRCLNGRSITKIAGTATLLAATDGNVAICKFRIALAIARQDQLEARLLMPAELGPYVPSMEDIT
ncbi:hypothetical protein [Paraburkholderia terrae]